MSLHLVFNPDFMGNNFNNNKLRVHENSIDKPVVFRRYNMFNWLSDILNSQVQYLEAKGVWLLIPVFGVQFFIYAFFANINGLTNAFDIIKNIIISLIGIAMGVMGVVNT